MKKNIMLVPEVIENKIFLLRGQKAMLDRDLAKLYGVTTGILNQAVKRNLYRFPEDFMFQLTRKETLNLKSQFVISSWGGDRGLPYVFSEQGVAMLSSVLNSKKAILVNIQIMRAFTRLRKIFLTHQDLQIKIEKLLRQQIRQAGHLAEHDRHISTIFSAIKQLLRNEAEISKQLTYTEKKEKNKKWGFQPPNRKK
ncbi:MAG: ORF6N domain-containing protein [Candidatus Margulisbacteria bacterium]|jgi:DNA-binding TFAR19-related protein (PDSD5 family)|nr:ORF6N domain-containing protein [Candidatus Margulisiibacteriota bacterium]